MRYWELLQEDNEEKIQELKTQIASIQTALKSKQEEKAKLCQTPISLSQVAKGEGSQVNHINIDILRLTHTLYTLEEELRKLKNQDYSVTGRVKDFGDKHGLKISDNANLVEKIKESCSDIIKIYKKLNQYLYRGMVKNSGSDIIHGLPRADRTTMNTYPELAIRIDNLLKKQGCVALRSNSIFCTSSEQLADNFGTVYVIFPVNGFNYTWTDVFDFPSKEATSEVIITDDILMAMTDAQLLEYLKPQTTNLEYAITNNRETLISAEYFAVQLDFLDSVLS